MCGIVGFFGTINNNYTSILTGMSSIIYRAPDSTGIGRFGDEKEPVRVRRALGPVSNLIRVLFTETSDASFNNAFFTVYSTGSRSSGNGSYPMSGRADLQKKLLLWEGFSSEEINFCTASFEELLQETTGQTIVPGTAGSDKTHYEFTVRNRDELQQLFLELSTQFNLSPTVTKELVKRELEARLARFDLARFDLAHSNQMKSEELEPDESEIVLEFDHVCAGITEEEGPVRNPVADKKLWEILSGVFAFNTDKTSGPSSDKEGAATGAEVIVPAEYDQDAVRMLFRLIDGALTVRLPYRPELREDVQDIFSDLWTRRREYSESDQSNAPEWLNTYTIEKELNVYGWAAAAALLYLKKYRMPGGGETSDQTPENSSATADPLTLRYFSQPVLAHGRWAIQSPVTVENAHPFFDQKKQRIIVLNGQFNAGVEADLKKFLQISGFRFRSGNSSEYVSLLWGYYFDVFYWEQERARTVHAQVDVDLERYAVGSQNIDYRIYRRLKGKSVQELDEFAFVEAARNIVKLGGQVAVSGISLLSPRRVYVAAHNRPVFIARTVDEDAVMVVSDIKAALGLFSQKLISSKLEELNRLDRDYREELHSLKSLQAGPKRIRACHKKYEQERAAVLESFRITVVPMEGRELFALIENDLVENTVRKRITIRNFDGESVTDLDEFEMVLDPSEGKQEAYRSFFETHIQEIPGRLNDMLRLYLPEDDPVPQFRIKSRYFNRRFGQKLDALRRILFVGMGSSYNMGLTAKGIFETVFPGKEVVVLKPSQIASIKKNIDPEGDLVLLLSWSGTTAEIIEFANELLRYNIAMIGVTNKPFSDLGLITWKSGGIIHIYSGEEITSSAVKSSLSMLFVLGLFSIRLLQLMNRSKPALRFVKNFYKIPDEIEAVIDAYAETDLLSVCAEAPRDYVNLFVIDTVFSNGTGRETALKLEENSGRLVGKTLDYRDVSSIDWRRYREGTLIIVNATCKARLAEALDCMKILFLSDTPFIALTYNHAQTDAIRYFSSNRAFIVRKLSDPLQPFINLPFSYLFTYRFSEREGLTIPGFPRNRAKSVTTSRSRSVAFSSFTSELKAFTDFLRNYGTVQEGLSAKTEYETARYTVWESEACSEWEKVRYRGIRMLMTALTAANPLDELLTRRRVRFEDLSKEIFELLVEDGELIFFPLDKDAQAGVEHWMGVWSYLVSGIFSVETNPYSLPHVRNNAAVIVVSSDRTDHAVVEKVVDGLKVNALWIGPALEENEERFFSGSLGFLETNEEYSCIPDMYIYSVFLTLFLHLFQLQSPKRAIPSGALFSILKEYILNGLMADASVRKQIHHAVEQNKSYKSTSFITPNSGTGLTWETVCDRTGRLFFSYHNFGDGGHGPLSTVDSRVDHKFVRIDDRENMVTEYGEDRVEAWEEHYLNGSSFDDFNRSPVPGERQHSETPFYSEGYWYLPEFCPNYHFGNDNLIILDGTSNRFIDQALDELSTYGCRYARIVTVTQDYFRLSGVKTELYSYPAGQVVFLTAVKNWAGKSFPIPDMFLPYAHNLVSTATASIASGKDAVFLQPEERERELFRSVFGLLGDAMLGIEISGGELTRNIIAALKSLSPLITKVEGYGRYRVKRIYDESELRTMLKPQREKHIGKQYIDEVISHFTILRDKGLPFFMLFPERETFQGDVLTPVYNYFDESGGGWQEALGTSWQSLAYDTLGIIESRTGFPLVEIPVIERRSSEGRLYHFYVRYQEWDCSQPMMPQVTVTLEAMQKGLTAMRQRSPGYIMMVNRFNEELVRCDIVWEDWLIVLVLRSMLMRKTSEELGRLIAKRIDVLLEDLYGYTNQENLQILKEDITAVWGRLRISPENDDDTRWKTLRRLLIKRKKVD